MSNPQCTGSFPQLRRSRTLLALLAVLILGLSVVAIMVYDGGSSQGNGVLVIQNPVPLATEKASENSRAGAPDAGAGNLSNPAAPSATTTPVDAPQTDPFKAALSAQGNTLPPPQPTATDRQPMEDPFKQALEQSNRRRAEAAVSPFAKSK